MALLGIGTIILTACGEQASSASGPGDIGGGGDGKVTFWSVEDNADRVEGTQAIIDRFTEETGVEVELAAIGEGDPDDTGHGCGRRRHPARCVRRAIARTHPHAGGRWVVDFDANAAVVDALGTDTFAQSAIDLVTTGDGLAGVPSDSWAQLLVYRKDLFEAAGLEPPTGRGH